MLDLSLQRAGWRKLAMLDAAESLADLMVPPREPARKAGRRSCRAAQHPDQRQWRICFRWTDAGPQDVEITDYH